MLPATPSSIVTAVALAMTKSVRKQVSALFAAGILVHATFFGMIHDRITGTSTSQNIRGSSHDPPTIHPKNDSYSPDRLDVSQGHASRVASARPIGLVDEGAIRQSPDDTSVNGTSSAEPVHLVYSSDDESIPGVVQSIKSVMYYASGPIEFHFVGDTPLPLELPNVHFYNITEINKQFKLKDFTNPRMRREKDRKTLNSSLANYVRFIMDSLLPNVSKAMWIDADTIVKCDVVEMIQGTFQTSNYAVAAVVVKGKPQGLARRIRTDYAYIKKSFNAGVFVAHLDRWRHDNLTDKIRNITLSNRKNNFYTYGSQPPLTLAIGNDFEHLKPSWNVKVPQMNRYFKDHGDKADICLLHWVGGSKPWEGHGQFRDWWKHVDKEVNRETMIKIAERNRAAKARKWKARVAAKKEKKLQESRNEQ